MTFVKLESVIKMIEDRFAVVPELTLEAAVAVAIALPEALRSLPTDDGEVLAKFAAEQKPLGAEFEAIWDANAAKLYGDDEVTDEMVERASKAVIETANWRNMRGIDEGSPLWGEKVARAALEAALGPLPARLVIDGRSLCLVPWR